MLVLGVGNPLRGDDGVGAHVAQRLVGKISFTVICCEATPENFVGPILEAKPDTILMVDAAELHAAPGTIRLLSTDDLSEAGISTHNMSPTGFLRFINWQREIGCLVLAVEPASRALGEGLSPVVARAAEEIVRALKELAAASPEVRHPRPQ